MEYITEIKTFYRLMQMKNLSTGTIVLWHALMYLNNECYWKEWFGVSNKTLELYTSLSRQAILKNRNVLKQIGLIDFKPNGTKATFYKINTISNNCQNSCQDGCQESCQSGCQDSSQLVVKKVAQSNRHKTKDIDKDIYKKENIKKKRYGEYSHVTLTDDEYEKLRSDYKNADELIVYLDEYIEMKDYKVKNCYLAIKKWVATAVEEQNKKNMPSVKKGPLNNFTSTTTPDFSKLTEQFIKKQNSDDELFTSIKGEKQ